MDDALPPDIQKLAKLTFRKFKNDPLDPAIDNHPLHDKRLSRHRRGGSRAVYVGKRYRAIYIEDDGKDGKGPR